MAEEVKIRVTQEAQGSALDDAKKDLQELKQEAAKPTSAAPMIAPAAPAAAAPATTADKVAKLRAEAAQQRGFAEQSAAKFGFHDVSAKSARASASALEREANRLERPANAEQKLQQREERNAKATALREERAAGKAAAAEQKVADAASVQAARERHKAEQVITREHRERAAVVKARESKLGRLGGAVANMAENAVGGSGFGGITSAARGISMPAMVLATLAVIGAKLAVAFAKQADQVQANALENRTASGVQNRRMHRMSGFEGSAGSARETAADLADSLNERNLKRSELQHAAKFKWYNPAGWIDHMTGASENAINQNEAGIGRDVAGIDRAKKIQKEKFGHEGAQEIAEQQALAKGDMNRARAIADQLTLYKEKIRLQRDGATEAEAEAGAEARVANIRRERAGQFGRFINSGTSAAAAARIATMAAQQSGMERDESPGELIAAVNGNHREAMNAATRKKFSDLQ